MANSSRTYFVYINERCHLLCHDPQKRTWLEYWMKGKIPYTSPDSPPPFGLYPVAMMTHYGVKRYTNLCVWQVSAGQWTSAYAGGGGGDKKDAAFEPLELKYRSEAERNCALDAVYEWVEAHPFERFQHEGLRGSLTHEVKVYYDLPTPKEESSRSWRAHWKRWKWVGEEWESLALSLAAIRNNRVPKGQPERIDLTRLAKARETGPGEDDQDGLEPGPEREYPAMLPPPTGKTYGLPPAPAPSVFLPPHIFHPASTVPVTPTPISPVPRIATPMFPYCPSPGTSPMTPSPLRRCCTPGLGSEISTPSPSLANLSPCPASGSQFPTPSTASVGTTPMSPVIPTPLRSCPAPAPDPRIFSLSPSILPSPATASLSFSTPASDPSRPWGLSALAPALAPAPTPTSAAISTQTPFPEPVAPLSVQKPPSSLPLPLPLSPSTVPPVSNTLAYEISNTPFRATKKPKRPAPSLKRKSTDDSAGGPGAAERGSDNDDVNGYADKIENEVVDGEEEENDTAREQEGDEQVDEQDQGQEQEQERERQQILKAEKRAQGPVTDLRGNTGSVSAQGQGRGARGTAGRGRGAGGRGGRGRGSGRR